MTEKWMIYGANGYTGELTARLAASNGLRPVLAGRNRKAIEALAEELRLECRVFDLREAPDNIKDQALVLHTAGPFVTTSAPMLTACLAAKVHYLDITGEISVFEEVFARDAEAKQAGITALPGVGFDVVPTDCLAAQLKAKLPAATHLELGFSSKGGISRGTMKTMLVHFPEGGATRQNGKLVKAEVGAKKRQIKFASGLRPAIAIPWGDISSAYFSTGIPNIDVYMAVSRRQSGMSNLLAKVKPVLHFKLARTLASAAIDHYLTGPDAATRQNGYCELWGEVRDRANRSVSATYRTPEGYQFTAAASLAAVARVLAGQAPVGAQTPSTAFGADFVTTLAGVSPMVFSGSEGGS